MMGHAAMVPQNYWNAQGTAQFVMYNLMYTFLEKYLIIVKRYFFITKFLIYIEFGLCRERRVESTIGRRNVRRGSTVWEKLALRRGIEFKCVERNEFLADLFIVQMIHLQSDIYCRKSVFDATHNASQKASHIARRLITGVFKPEAIKRCTLTGQTPRSLGRQRLYDKVDCLHVVARNTIIGNRYFILYFIFDNLKPNR